MKNQLDKIIYFVKNTGDRVIVLKDDSEFVVIPLDEYEGLFRHKKELTAMTEEEILSRVNREIALWRESQKICTDDIDFPEDEAEDYFPANRLSDNDFYYNHQDKATSDDRWVESDWFSAEDEEVGNFSSGVEDVEEDLELSQELMGDEELWEDKKGAEDVSLPLKEKKLEVKQNSAFESMPMAEQPVIIPKKRINNFGYSNPSDTDDLTQERGYSEEYGHIPPPPSR